MRVTALASGSNGNCYYFENDDEAILVDVGVSCKQVVLRLNNLGIDISKVKGIFITHEHSDHIRGVEVLSKKYDIPVYITKKTYDNCRLSIREDLINYIETEDKVEIGNIKINSFTKSHDAADPCSFNVSCNDKNVCVLTDFGKECNNVIDNIKNSDAVFLETNYDDEMLMNGPYPYMLKQRVSGEEGHYSNLQAATLVLNHANPKLKKVFLSHLSTNNNDPEIAFSTVNTLINERNDLEIQTILTSRDNEIELHDIE